MTTTVAGRFATEKYASLVTYRGGKYGFQGRFLVRRSLRRGGPEATIGLRITFPDAT